MRHILAQGCRVRLCCRFAFRVCRRMRTGVSVAARWDPAPSSASAVSSWPVSFRQWEQQQDVTFRGLSGPLCTLADEHPLRVARPHQAGPPVGFVTLRDARPAGRLRPWSRNMRGTKNLRTRKSPTGNGTSMQHIPAQGCRVRLCCRFSFRACRRIVSVDAERGERRGTLEAGPVQG